MLRVCHCITIEKSHRSQWTLFKWIAVRPGRRQRNCVHFVVARAFYLCIYHTKAPHDKTTAHHIYICWGCGSKRRQLYYCGFLRDCFFWVLAQLEIAHTVRRVSRRKDRVTNQIKLWLLVWWNIKVLDEPNVTDIVHKSNYTETFQLKYM